MSTFNKEMIKNNLICEEGCDIGQSKYKCRFDYFKQALQYLCMLQIVFNNALLAYVVL